MPTDPGNKSSPLSDWFKDFRAKAWSILQASIRAVPATKYALGAIGFGAAGAIALRLLGSPSAAVIAVATALFFSVIVLLFVRLAKAKPETFKHPAQVLLWAMTILFVLGMAALFTSFFLDVPLHLAPRKTAAAQLAPQRKVASVRLLAGRSTDDPVFWLFDEGDVDATQPHYEMRLYDLSSPDPQDPKRRLDLKIPSATTGSILAHAKDPEGPFYIRKIAGRGTAIKKGDRLFGHVKVSCSNCNAAREFWLFVIHGVDGWVQEIKNPDPKRTEEILAAAQSDENFDPNDWIAHDDRIPCAHYAGHDWVWDPHVVKRFLQGSTEAHALNSLDGWKTWDGRIWRDYEFGDEELEGVIVVRHLEGGGSIEPSIPVVTRPSEMSTLDAMHDRYRP